MQDPENSILLFHPPSLDPRPFLSRLLSLSSPIPEDTSTVPWRIDNKYYTVAAHFLLTPISSGDVIQASEVPVVIYLFAGSPPRPLPASLTKLVISEPRDIALAIRTRDPPDTDGDDAGAAIWDEVEEVFGELGIELVDEVGVAEDDDERPMSPLEEVRQTLMTHMWPGMVRKATSGPSGELIDSDEDDLEEYEEEEESAVFPVTFAPSTSQTKEGVLSTTDFPGLEELRRELPDGQEDEEVHLEEEEYARLDDWLDDEDGDEFVALPEDQEDHDELEGSIVRSRSPSPPAEEKEEAGFEDDFDDFAPFQAAPHRRSGREEDGGHGLLSMDPTPLLLHLQAVRAELAGVEDEDDRRKRAGKEVERVMRGMGMGDLDFGMGDEDGDEMDRIGGFDAGALGGLSGL